MVVVLRGGMVTFKMISNKHPHTILLLFNCLFTYDSVSYYMLMMVCATVDHLVNSSTCWYNALWFQSRRYNCN